MRSKEVTMWYQQGDVIIEPAEIPENATVRRAKNGRHVLAEGEATGHAHAIATAPHVRLRETPGGRLWLSVTRGEATVTHEEHGSVVLPAGNYAVRKVREYDHFAEEARNVQD